MPSATQRSNRARTLFPYLVAIAVLISRALTSGPPYYVDGPRHLNAIANHSFAIQPPGYWLFTRLGSLFRDPEHGIHYMNWVFSALGAFVFYFVSKRLLQGVLVELATILYASLFTAWFAGSIHSTYAAELFFPPLLMLFILRYKEKQRIADLLGACVAFSLATGFRPSDGVFLGPLFLFFLYNFVSSWRERILAVSVVAVVCLAWFIPNQLALRQSAARDARPDAHWKKLEVNTDSNLTQLERMAPLFHPGKRSLIITSALRILFPLALAFWPIAPWLFRSTERSEVKKLLWLWIVPGFVFFLLIFVSDVLYCSYLLGAIVLILCSGPSTRIRSAAVVLCIAFNVMFFLLARPVRVSSLPTAVFDAYGAKFTVWGIKNQYYQVLKDLYPVPKAAKP